MNNALFILKQNTLQVSSQAPTTPPSANGLLGCACRRQGHSCSVQLWVTHIEVDEELEKAFC